MSPTSLITTDGRLAGQPDPLPRGTHHMTAQPPARREGGSHHRGCLKEIELEPLPSPSPEPDLQQAAGAAAEQQSGDSALVQRTRERYEALRLCLLMRAAIRRARHRSVGLAHVGERADPGRPAQSV